MDIQCIYQLICKDKNITETYIGSTVNYRKRMMDIIVYHSTCL